jgi:hypothetical protein
MDISSTVKTIHSLHKTISGKSDIDLIMVFKGYDAGISKPFIARIEAKECLHATFEGALKGLLTLLKGELATKVKFAEEEAIRLKSVLVQLEN